MSCHCLSGKSSPPLKSFQGSFFGVCRLVFNMDLVRASPKKRKAGNQRKRKTRGVRTCEEFRTRNQAKTKPRGRRMAERSQGRFFRTGSPATAIRLSFSLGLQKALCRRNISPRRRFADFLCRAGSFNKISWQKTPYWYIILFNTFLE